MLHTLNRLLESNEDLQLVTQMLIAGDTVLLYEQGVKALRDEPMLMVLRKWHSEGVVVCCLQSDCQENGVKLSTLEPEVLNVIQFVDYDGFVDLVVSHSQNQAL